MNFFDYFKAIAEILIIILAAFYVTRLVAKTGAGRVRRGSAIKLVDMLPLSKDKSVAVVEIGEYDYILGVGGQHVERLDKIPSAELNIKEEETTPGNFSINFREVLKSGLKRPMGH
jgi:Flagellar biogenesis protein